MIFAKLLFMIWNISYEVPCNTLLQRARVKRVIKNPVNFLIFTCYHCFRKRKILHVINFDPRITTSVCYMLEVQYQCVI